MPSTPRRPRIRRATIDDLDLAAGILTAGFFDDPVSRWLIPVAAERQQPSYGYFRLFVRHGLDAGTVHLVDDEAVAVWFPHDAPDAADLDAELRRICGRHAPRYTEFGQIMHDRHPAGPAHEYLMLLATAPDRRGRGHGSALLAYRHAQLDPVGRPTYLEATTRRAADGVYARAGYRPFGEPIEFPGGLTTYPLWRAAGGHPVSP